MTTPNTSLFPTNVAAAIQDLTDPSGITGQAFSYTESVIRSIAAFNFINMTRSTTAPGSPTLWDLWDDPATLSGTTITDANITAWDGTAWVNITPGIILANMAQDAQTQGISLPGIAALPTNAAGTLTNDGAGNLSWVVSAASLPADSQGYLTNDGAGATSWTPTTWTTATRPTGPVGVAGYNTTTSAFEVWDGTAWGEVGAAIQVWATAGRPGTPAAGDTGFNSDLVTLETYDGANWIPAGPVVTASATPPANASLGDIWTDTDDDITYMRVTDGTSEIWRDVTTASASTNSVSSVTADATATAGQEIWVDTSGAAVTITLPATPAAGDSVRIFRVGANDVTVNGNGTNIDGNATFTLNVQDVGARFVFILGQWQAVERNVA